MTLKMGFCIAIFVLLSGCASPAPNAPLHLPALVTLPERGAVRLNSFQCFEGACPLGAPADNALIVREIYALSANGQTKFADWVAYVVTPESIGRSQSRGWAADPWLDPSETLEPDDYAGANAALGVDRGHQAPLAAFSGTPHWADTNYLSNITPQMAALNQGPWQRLEARERALAQAGTRLFVLTGPLYERDVAPLPNADEPHMISSGYWKVIARADPPAASAFIMDQHTPRGAQYCDHLVSLADVQARTGLELYPRQRAEFQSLATQLGC